MTGRAPRIPVSDFGSSLGADPVGFPVRELVRARATDQAEAD